MARTTALADIAPDKSELAVGLKLAMSDGCFTDPRLRAA